MYHENVRFKKKKTSVLFLKPEVVLSSEPVKMNDMASSEDEMTDLSTVTFEIQLPDDDMSDEDIENYITNLDFSSLMDLQDIDKKLTQSADPVIPSPGQPVSPKAPGPNTSRFRKSSVDDRKKYEDAYQAKSTKKKY